MGASMNSLGKLVVSSSKARKQLLQALNPEDRSIAKALRPILDEFDELSKEQRAQLYEQMQITFDAIGQVEAHAAQQIAQKNFELPKLPNDDDDWAEMQRMVDREMARQQARKPTVSPVRSPASLEPSAPSPASPASPARSPARDARDLYQKPMQKPFISSPHSLFRTPTGSPVRHSTPSPRGSPSGLSTLPPRTSHLAFSHLVAHLATRRLLGIRIGNPPEIPPFSQQGHLLEPPLVAHLEALPRGARLPSHL